MFFIIFLTTSFLFCLDASFNPLVPPEISDSLQAELHLSLDRLSENSYDQDDLNRIKVRKHSSVREKVM